MFKNFYKRHELRKKIFSIAKKTKLIFGSYLFIFFMSLNVLKIKIEIE